jgi:hypothetical protein
MNMHNCSVCNKNDDNVFNACACDTSIHLNCLYKIIDNKQYNQKCDTCNEYYKLPLNVNEFNRVISFKKFIPCNICNNTTYSDKDIPIKINIEENKYVHKSCLFKTDSADLTMDRCQSCNNNIFFVLDNYNIVNGFYYPCDCLVHELCLKQFIGNNRKCHICCEKYNINYSNKKKCTIL